MQVKFVLCNLSFLRNDTCNKILCYGSIMDFIENWSKHKPGMNPCWWQKMLLAGILWSRIFRRVMYLSDLHPHTTELKRSCILKALPKNKSRRQRLVINIAFWLTYWCLVMHCLCGGSHPGSGAELCFCIAEPYPGMTGDNHIWELL